VPSREEDDENRSGERQSDRVKDQRRKYRRTDALGLAEGAVVVVVLHDGDDDPAPGESDPVDGGPEIDEGALGRLIVEQIDREERDDRKGQRPGDKNDRADVKLDRGQREGADEVKDERDDDNHAKDCVSDDGTVGGHDAVRR
jgi:hypothetical protein